MKLVSFGLSQRAYGGGGKPRTSHVGLRLHMGIRLSKYLKTWFQSRYRTYFLIRNRILVSTHVDPDLRQLHSRVYAV